MTSIFVQRAPTAYVNSDDLPVVKNYITELVTIPALKGWWSFLTSQATIDTGKVTAIANRKSGAPAAANAVAAQQGAIASSSLLRREVLNFPNDGITKNYPVSGLGWDSGSAWTMVAVFKPIDYVNRTVCGMQVGATDWASIFCAQTGAEDAIRCRYADYSAEVKPEAGWQTVIGAGKPGAVAQIEVNGVYAVGGALPSADPTTDTFMIGNNGFNFYGEMAEVGLFQEDLFAPGNETKLALVRDFITSIRVAGG